MRMISPKKKKKKEKKKKMLRLIDLNPRMNRFQFYVQAS